MDIVYRRATVDELPRILILMQAGNLDTRELHTEDILVAVAGDGIVGVNRLKKYSDGANEIASAYVVPEYRELGINRRLTEILRDECEGPVFIITHPDNEEYVGRMGFVRKFYSDVLPDSIRSKVDWCRERYKTHEPGIFCHPFPKSPTLP